MIKTLQKKFIITSMTAISVLIIVLLGGINIFNISSVSKQNKNTLDFLVSSSMPEQPMRPDGIRPPDNNGRFDIRPPEEDRQQSAVYFKVSEDGNGKVINIDVSRIPSVTQSEAKEIYDNITDSEGKTGSFIYKTRMLPDGLGREIYFLSLSEQNYSVLRVALLSVGAGIVCWGLMLLIIVLLSRKAIRPIAENLEKQKQFITDAGHEIKTPLAIIMANTEALELHNGENKWTGNIKNQTLRLNGLMQNLLLLAKANGSEAPIKKESVSLSDIVIQAVDSFSESAKKRNLSFKSDIESGVIIEVDKEQITSLASILIDNAVKYACKNSDIEIKLKKDKNAVLSVKNKCDALPECPPENLFDRFYRGDSARTQKSGGYGIGLSSAKAITELHGGTITAMYSDGNIISFEVKL